MTRILTPLLLLFAAAAVLLAANPCRAQSYTLTEIAISPTAINNNGQIGGQAPLASDPSSVDPFILSNGTLEDLGSFGGSCDVYGCRAYAVNSLGDAVGLTADGAGSYAPFLFSNGTLTELSVNGGTPQGINTAGTVVGYFGTPCSSPCGPGFMFSNGTLTILPIDAAAINTSGQIAGGAANPSSQPEAAVLQPDGTITFLGFLPGENNSRAFAINDAGQVTGNAYTTVPQYALHAFLYSDGKMTDIDTFDSQASWGFGINSNGVVVGMFTPSSTSMAYDAFVYMGGSMMDLNTLIPAGSGLTLVQAKGINDAGEIVGQAQSNSDGSVHGFLLTPVPPQITSISPTTGAAGTLVTINGKNFTKKPAACKVTINGKVAKATKWSNTQIKVEVPAGATTGKLVVTAFFQKSNSKTFTVTE